MSKMKLLHLDVELSPNLATVWGIYKQNIAINQLLETSRVMCYAAKWHGQKTILFDSEQESDRGDMISGLHDLMSEADAICHYNGNRFDIPVINKEFLLEELGPPAPFRNIDLLQVVRKRFRFTSNKLDHVAQELGIGHKVQHYGHQLWLDCMAGDAKAWAIMKKYNRQDVQLLEELYDRITPWIDNHPNSALYITPGVKVCPNCGSDDLHYHGYSHTKVQSYRRLQCNSCGTWSRERYSALDPVDRKLILTQESLSQ